METRDGVREPVMLGRIVEPLSPVLTSPSAVYVNYTLGLGGYTRTVLGVAPSARLIGTDHDPDVLAAARERPGPLAERTTLVKAVYDELSEVLADLGIGGVHAVLAGLRLSSLQIDREEWGFAYRVGAPLDMYISRGEGRSAAGLLNSAPPVELVRVLRHYSEERFARRTIAAVVEEREVRPFKSSGQLVEVISNAIPAAARHSPGHPAKRTFQTLRVAVNDELAILEKLLPTTTAALALEGRLVVLSCRSLEDRPVKRHLAALAADGVPRDMPAVPKHLKPRFKPLTRGAERSPEQEVRSNPRTASTRLRAAA